MSHFTVLVIGDNPEEQLAPFDENIELPRYLAHTKEQLIEISRKRIKDFENGLYADYLKDPEEYLKNSFPAHAEYIVNKFPKKLNFTDDECYQDEIRFYEPEDIDENGGVYSTYNPNSKWDWYQLGGRWRGFYKLKDGKTGELGQLSWANDEPVGDNTADSALKGNIDFENIDQYRTFAVVKDGVWYERGEMGWWGIVINPKSGDAWDEEFDKLISNLPDDTLLSVYDCHI